MMGNQSFGITTAVKYYEQLFRPRYEAFFHEPGSPEFSILFALAAYHLREWVWQDRGSLDFAVAGLQSTNERDFNASVNSRCTVYPIIRDIANGSKHCVLTNSKTTRVKGSGPAEWGDLAWGEFASDRLTLKVELDDGSSKSVDSIFQEIADFWEGFFSAQVSR